MLYYFDWNAFKIVETTADDVIDTFSETTTSPRGVMPKYFYEDNAIWRWSPSGRKEHLKNCTKEEAKKQLLDWAISDAAQEPHNFVIHKSKQAVLNEIKNSIEDDGRWDLNDKWDLELLQKLNQVLEENQN